MGRAYVGFARTYPGLFLLMFRSERLDMARPALREAVEGARQALRVAAMSSATVNPLAPLQLAARATAFARRFDAVKRALAALDGLRGSIGRDVVLHGSYPKAPQRIRCRLV